MFVFGYLLYGIPWTLHPVHLFHVNNFREESTAAEPANVSLSEYSSLSSSGESEDEANTDNYEGDSIT